ncbi:MAG: hypothetical protein V3U75_12865 [Methylococcaceae bacterium]
MGIKSIRVLVGLVTALCVLTFAPVTSLAQIKKKNKDFRQADWGMTKEQVKKTENGKPVKEDDKTLAYQGKLLNLDCLIIYQFFDEKLTSSGYNIAKHHTNRNDYISDYDNLKDKLIEKYGKPLTEGDLWKNDLYKNDPQNWGLAVSIGHLIYLAKWETDRTDINLALAGDNFEITLALFYASKELRVLEEKARKKKTLGDF